MNHKEHKKKYSRLTIDRFLMGQLDTKTTDDIYQAMGKNNILNEVIQNRKNQADDFLEQYPTFSDLCEGNQKQQQVSWRGGKSLFPFFNLRKEIMFSVGFAVVISCLLVVWPHLNHKNQTEVRPLNTKGITQVGLIIKRGTKTKEIKERTVFCMPADTLQFYIISPASIFYAIYSVDKQGKFEKYLPVDNKLTKAGNASGETVSRSLILSEDWAGEVIKCLYSKREFTPKEAVAELTNGHNPQNSSLFIETFVLKQKKK